MRAKRLQPDMARLANALSIPGIDPRIWVSYAYLTSEPYIETVEGREDIVADIVLLPSQQEETARVGAIYAGNGFGFYCPLHAEDEVLVVAPSGDPDEGLVITQRLWSPADPPPQEVIDNPEDVTLVVEEGKNLRLHVLGAGNVVLSAEEGKIKLGGEDAEKGVARMDDTTDNGTFNVTANPLTGQLIFTYAPPGGTAQSITVQFAIDAAPTVISPLPPIPATFNLAGVIDSSSDQVEST